MLLKNVLSASDTIVATAMDNPSDDVSAANCANMGEYSAGSNKENILANERMA